MARFCPNCGTEVDENASFCPTCGQPLDEPMTAPEAPRPAPGWDDEPPARAEEARAEEAAPAEEPTRAERPVEPREGAPQAAAPAAGRRSAFPSARQLNLPVTWPVTLSGWLIGVGALVGVLAMFLPWIPSDFGGAFGGFDSFVNIVLLILLLGVAAWVFLSTLVPQVRHQRLAILAVALVGLGIALDRIGIGGFGIGVVLFLLAMLAATIGALLLELGMDRPVGVPTGGRKS
jgi:hypothetical protein